MKGEQIRVVGKAELRHPILEMNNCCIDTGCKESTDRRRTNLGGENGTNLRVTKKKWAGPDIT